MRHLHGGLDEDSLFCMWKWVGMKVIDSGNDLDMLPYIAIYQE